jgi:hypothetical protein
MSQPPVTKTTAPAYQNRTGSMATELMALCNSVEEWWERQASIQNDSRSTSYHSYASQAVRLVNTG